MDHNQYNLEEEGFFCSLFKKKYYLPGNGIKVFEICGLK